MHRRHWFCLSKSSDVVPHDASSWSCSSNVDFNLKRFAILTTPTHPRRVVRGSHSSVSPSIQSASLPGSTLLPGYGLPDRPFIERCRQRWVVLRMCRPFFSVVHAGLGMQPWLSIFLKRSLRVGLILETPEMAETIEDIEKVVSQFPIGFCPVYMGNPVKAVEPVVSLRLIRRPCLRSGLFGMSRNDSRQPETGRSALLPIDEIRRTPLISRAA